jgi:hypothetical protein
MPNIKKTGRKMGAISGRECARATNAIFFPFNNWSFTELLLIEQTPEGEKTCRLFRKKAERTNGRSEQADW